MNAPNEGHDARICVTLVGATVDENHAFAARAKERGASMVEYRLDAMRPDAIDLEALVKKSPLPAVVTFRLPADGGKRTEDEGARIALLKRALELGAAYVDIERGRAGELADAAPGRVIESFHDMDATPADIAEIAASMAAGPAAVVKIATTARGVQDTFVIYDILAKAKKPTVAFCMGAAGSSSRVLSLRFGAAWTYAALDDDHEGAPGQISIERMFKDFSAPDAHPDAPFYGVIGHPIGHTMSPQMHNASLRERGLGGAYVSFDVEGDVPGFVRTVFALGARGLSVTIPHKLAVMEAVDEVEPAAKRIGAVNTVYMKDGRLLGTNTDFYGAQSAIVNAAGGIAALAGKAALVVGAGGASRAIVFGLRDAGMTVSVSDIVEEKARELAGVAEATFVPHAEVDVSAYDVIANASPVGMHPKVDACPIETSGLREGQIVFDAVYNPRETKLLREAGARGCVTVSGVEMFVGQGAKQFELFTGQPAPTDVMRSVVLERLG